MISEYIYHGDTEARRNPIENSKIRISRTKCNVERGSLVNVKSYPIAVVVFILLVGGLAQAAQSDIGPDLNGQVQLQIVNTSLVSYSASKLVLGITLAMSSKRDLTVEQIVLTGLRLNGLPLYAAPIKQRLQLHSDEKMLLHDPLPVTVYFRDLDTVSPLAKAIATGHTTVDGTAYATVRVNP